MENTPKPKSEDRLLVLKRIEELEKEGKFDIDVEDDPETRPLKPGEVDFLRKKLSSKIKTWFAFKRAKKFLNQIIENKVLIIDDIIGIENIDSLNSGAVMTLNHFNAFDSFAAEIIYRNSIQFKKKKRHFYRIIREGNYTSFPGFYGSLMRNCRTLPLSKNPEVLKEFMRATNTLLKQGEIVLIYPEQSMWWNYRKPKPLQKGAFSFAAKNNVPVLPCFITMRDTDQIGDDGFPIQAYTLHVAKPIYPDNNLSVNENINMLRDKNYQIWKDIYEDFYKIPLKYLCDEKED
ncbi:MAG: 1-acyl-sn-glycerol-3-phosphate acyltransferase [Acholeplasmatales bacterium]|nr:1-acyl-sn-glycerol-3-phosphate acyltransferase [Acholeplasmatales bacterium]